MKGLKMVFYVTFKNFETNSQILDWLIPELIFEVGKMSIKLYHQNKYQKKNLLRKAAEENCVLIRNDRPIKLAAFYQMITNKLFQGS